MSDYVQLFTQLVDEIADQQGPPHPSLIWLTPRAHIGGRVGAAWFLEGADGKPANNGIHIDADSRKVSEERNGMWVNAWSHDRRNGLGSIGVSVTPDALTIDVLRQVARMIGLLPPAPTTEGKPT